MKLINSTINFPGFARRIAEQAYPIGRPVEVVSGETVIAEEYREVSLLSPELSDSPFFPSYKNLADAGMIRLEVWGEIKEAA